MRVQWSDFGIAALLVSAAGALVYVGLEWSLRRALAEQQAANDRQLAALATTVKALQGRVAELNRLAGERAGEVPMTADAGENMPMNDPMKPEMLAVITAAATSFLGKRARIRSAKLVPVEEPVSAWTQQGRTIVQTSHNLRSRD